MLSKWHEIMCWKCCVGIKNTKRELGGCVVLIATREKKLETENWIQKVYSASASDWSKWYVVLLLIDARIISRIIVDGRWTGDGTYQSLCARDDRSCVPELFAWWWWWCRWCRWWWFYLAVTSCLHPPSLHPCPFSWSTKPWRRDLRDGGRTIWHRTIWHQDSKNGQFGAPFFSG